MVVMTKSKPKPFWETKSLTEMTRREWESLCDGCAKCCLHKLEDMHTREVFYTSVVCQHLDQNKCRCTVYRKRKNLVPDCLVLTPDTMEDLDWAPGTCAYRLVKEGKPLPDWHPLLTGSRDDIIATDNTITGKVISEEFVHVDAYEDYLIDWAD